MKNTDKFHKGLKDYDFTEYKFKSKASKRVRKRIYRGFKRAAKQQINNEQ